MPRSYKPVWVLKSSYYVQRWRDWLAQRRAPDIQEWAETRDGFDVRLARPEIEYLLPSTVPPCGDDDAARERVYDFIRCRLAAARKAA